MNDRSENKLSMLHAVNNYLGTPAAALLTANTTVTTRKATLASDLASVATLLGTKTLLASEGIGATAAKTLTRAELNRLILKVSGSLVSAFTANGDIENTTAVRLNKSKIARTRDQNIPALVTLLTTKASLLGSTIAAHNLTSTELSLLSTTAGTWGSSSSKSTAKKSGSSSNL